MLRCECCTPFGIPVDPEENNNNTSSSSFTGWHLKSSISTVPEFSHSKISSTELKSEILLRIITFVSIFSSWNIFLSTLPFCSLANIIFGFVSFAKYLNVTEMFRKICLYRFGELFLCKFKWFFKFIKFFFIVKNYLPGDQWSYQIFKFAPMNKVAQKGLHIAILWSEQIETISPGFISCFFNHKANRMLSFANFL